MSNMTWNGKRLHELTENELDEVAKQVLAAKALAMQGLPHGNQSVIDAYDRDLEEIYAEMKSRPAVAAVNHPAHYNQGSIECIDALRAALIDQ
jgi:hypothetical protein